MVRVNTFAALVVPILCGAKVRLVGDRVTEEEDATPVPASATVCGEPPALSVMTNAPVRVPLVVGLKVTEILQLAAPATPLPQVLVSAKSPEVAIDEMLNAD